MQKFERILDWAWKHQAFKLAFGHDTVYREEDSRVTEGELGRNIAQVLDGSATWLILQPTKAPRVSFNIIPYYSTELESVARVGFSE